MKRFLLPVLSWTMAISQMFAQKQMPPSIQLYAANLGYSAKQMLHAAGIETPGAQPEYQITRTIKPRTTTLQLDSTVVYSGFAGQDSMPVLRNIHTNPQKNKEVIVESYFDLKQWIPLSRTTLVANDFGQLVETTSEIFDTEAGVFLPDSKIDLYPRGEGALLDSFFVSGWAPELNTWKCLLGTWNNFDAQDRQTESLSSLEFFDVPLYFLDRYRYNDEGDLTTINSFNLSGGEEFPSGKQEMIYNNHLLQSQTNLTFDGLSTYFPESKLEYTYTDFEKEELINYYAFDVAKNDWHLINVNGYAYDDQHRVILHEIVTAADAENWDRVQHHFTYVQDDNKASDITTHYDFAADTWIVDEKQYFYYTELVATDPEPAHEEAFLYPNPTTGFVQLKLPGKLNVYVYNMSGQLIRNYKMESGDQRLNLSYLPAGIYQVHAWSGDDYFSSKLVVQ